MFAWASQCFYRTLLLYFPFIICFGFLPTNSMVLGCVQAFQFAPYTSHCNHLDCPNLTREHIHYAWNSQHALTSYLGKNNSSSFFHPWCQLCLLFKKLFAKFGPGVMPPYPTTSPFP